GVEARELAIAPDAGRGLSDEQARRGGRREDAGELVRARRPFDPEVLGEQPRGRVVDADAAGAGGRRPAVPGRGAPDRAARARGGGGRAPGRDREPDARDARGGRERGSRGALDLVAGGARAAEDRDEAPPERGMARRPVLAGDGFERGGRAVVQRGGEAREDG